MDGSRATVDIERVEKANKGTFQRQNGNKKGVNPAVELSACTLIRSCRYGWNKNKKEKRPNPGINRYSVPQYISCLTFRLCVSYSVILMQSFICLNLSSQSQKE